MSARDIKPKNLTEGQWESVKQQADNFGAIFELGCPGTKYDRTSMCLDYSQNKELVATLGKDADGTFQLFMPVFAQF